jgi:uncharacterized protein
MTRTLMVFTLALVLLYAAICLVTYLRQRQLMYFPTPPHDAVDLAPLWIESGGERLKLWALNPGQDQAIVYFGGNAEQPLYGREMFERALPSHTVYLVNYRGYGGSSGSPSETAFHDDGLRIFDTVAARHGGVALIGRSIGSAVATHVAARRPATALALVTPMDSMEALAQHYYPLLPVKLLLKDRYRAIDSARLVTARTLAVIAADDRIIPLENSQRLVDALRSAPVTVEILEHHGHNNLGHAPDYGNLLRDFFAPGR